MGAGLHEPVVICFPFVIGELEVKQKLIKLLLDVRDATWPAAGTLCPLFSKPVAMTFGSRAVVVSFIYSRGDIRRTYSGMFAGWHCY